jgi:hypothetical protein
VSRNRPRKKRKNRMAMVMAKSRYQEPGSGAQDDLDDTGWTPV